MITIADVEAAARRLAGVAHRTPVFTSRTLDGVVGGAVFLKGEHLQRAGAFKFRGAYNTLAAMPAAERARGVCTISSGNHAAAVALAASLLDTTAVILMPDDAPDVKVAATASYGGQMVTFNRYTDDRDELIRSFVAERGLPLVHPYDDPLIMAGQGTAALELFSDLSDGLDVLVVPMSGGGLMAGCATVAAARVPGIRIVGVEPEAADDTVRSFSAGSRVRIDVGSTIADGLQVAMPGELTWEVNHRLVSEVVTVSDEEIVAAMVFLFDRLKQVVEPSGAVGVAALLTGRVSVPPGARVGVVLSGGNVGAARFASLVGSSA